MHISSEQKVDMKHVGSLAKRQGLPAATGDMVGQRPSMPLPLHGPSLWLLLPANGQLRLWGGVPPHEEASLQPLLLANGWQILQGGALPHKEASLQTLLPMNRWNPEEPRRKDLATNVQKPSLK